MIPVTQVEDSYIITIDSFISTIVESDSATYVIETVESATDISITEPQQDVIEISDRVFIEAPMLTKRVDFVNDLEFYKGEAIPGTSENSPAWRISFTVIGTDGDVSERWAAGNSNFDKTWTERTLLPYI